MYEFLKNNIYFTKLKNIWKFFSLAWKKLQKNNVFTRKK